jgi:ATP diphosphatase
MERLLDIMARLRDREHGCPWDVAQTFRTIAPYTVEEAYEVADAIERNDFEALKHELGDLLLQVVFHARMAEEAERFDFDAIAAAISEKMIDRHPHVFGTARIETAEAQTFAWEEAKAAEQLARARTSGRASSALDGVTAAMPALMRAEKLQKRAARVGFDWPDRLQVIDKVAEELSELQSEIARGPNRDRVEDEIGDLLFAVVNLARHLNVDPESALRRGNSKFERRFRAMERSLTSGGRHLLEIALEEMEAAWRAAKAEEP